MKNDLAVARYMLSSMLRDIQMIQTTFEKFEEVGQAEQEHLRSAMVSITMVCSKLRALDGDTYES